jgi:hypothetical protein
MDGRTSRRCFPPGRGECTSARAAPGNAFRVDGAACALEPLPANTWTPQNLALLVERLGGAIVSHALTSGIGASRCAFGGATVSPC